MAAVDPRRRCCLLLTLRCPLLLPHPTHTRTHQAHGGDPLIPFSGALEAKLLDMPEDEREVYCKEVRLPAVLAVQCCYVRGVGTV